MIYTGPHRTSQINRRNTMNTQDYYEKPQKYWEREATLTGFQWNEIPLIHSRNFPNVDYVRDESGRYATAIYSYDNTEYGFTTSNTDHLLTKRDYDLLKGKPAGHNFTLEFWHWKTKKTHIGFKFRVKGETQ